MTSQTKMQALIRRGVRQLRDIVQKDGDVRETELTSELASLEQKAEAAQASRAWAEAEALWHELTELRPEHTRAHIQLGNMLNELGRPLDAIAAFQVAGRLDPELADAPAGVAGVYERTGEWDKAASAWEDALVLLQAIEAPRSVGTDSQLAHAFGHAALSAHLAGKPFQTADILIRAATALPGFQADKKNLRIRAQITKEVNLVRAEEMLRDYLEAFPEDDDARFEYASMCLQSGRYPDGLAGLLPALDRRQDDVSFLRLAADLNERLRRWSDVQSLAEQLSDLAPGALDHLQRAFNAAAQVSDLIAARRFARMHARRSGELILIHELLRLYEEAEEFVHARLLCRWLRRRWAHSRWHAGHYIRLTARTRSLDEADRLVREEITAGRRDVEIDRAYAQAAYDSGDHVEAQRRLVFYQDQHAGDDDMHVLLGYAIANTAGIVEAENHFTALATSSYQAIGPLTGLAHMAMRRRDTAAAYERWAKIATLYPDNTIAHVEQARSAYELRDVALSESLCSKRLAAVPSDVTMGEFQVWLLAAISRYQNALDAIAAMRAHSNPSWTLLELGVRSAGFLGTMAAEWPNLMALMPHGTTWEDSRRFYHVVRGLVTAGRTDMIRAAVEQSRLPSTHLPWLAPYLKADSNNLQRLDGPALQRSWGQTRDQIRDDAARRLRGMSDIQVRELLARPPAQQPTVHIVNKFEQVGGGSELHALDLAGQLSQYARVDVWAPEMPHPSFSREHNVHNIDPSRGQVPHGGTLVLIGVYFSVGSWIAHARPNRVIFLYNTFEAPLVHQRAAEVYAKAGIRSELLFCSDMMGQECGLPGLFEPSPTDLVSFCTAPGTKLAGAPFTLGRHSRDVTEKHHPDDWRIYEAVAEVGGVSKVLGGTCMRSAFPAIPGMQLLPAQRTGIPSFLQGLDAYLYRTSTWVEPWGRVVIEAMACGLPVLAHSVGGYAQVIQHEVNGLLFDTTDQAIRLVRRLAEEPALRLQLGRAARATVEELLSPEKMNRLVAFYLLDASST